MGWKHVQILPSLHQLFHAQFDVVRDHLKRVPKDLDDVTSKRRNVDLANIVWLCKFTNGVHQVESGEFLVNGSLDKARMSLRFEKMKSSSVVILPDGFDPR